MSSYFMTFISSRTFVAEGVLLSIAWTGRGRMLTNSFFCFLKSILFAFLSLARIMQLPLYSNYCYEHERRVGTTMCETSW
ncbi:hypothetical protein B0F90DRAFT_1685326 [Multifurca ochricompacta]|uniref:Uncharacterized protein n=1 Tax=Multifurca ochricompacta TaxID=376703 RepID=A0AAD4QQY0_9AGAM|nr:hypothetical protein B0F90DRAFT_1685326 [Multifurca ochricompacta]